jgi:hypothetical protein
VSVPPPARAQLERKIGDVMKAYTLRYVAGWT